MDARITELVARLTALERERAEILPISSCLLVAKRRCQSKEYEHGPIEAQDILVVQAPDMRTDLGFRNGSYLVHHEVTRDA